MVSKDHCVYVKRSIEGIMFLNLYIDDILLDGNKLKMIEATKKWLSSVFEMKDIGEVRYVLRVEIIRDRPKKLLGMSYEEYIKKVLERFRMHYFKLVDTLVEKGLTLILDQCPKTDNEKEAMNDVLYAGAVGGLNVCYVMYTT